MEEVITINNASLCEVTERTGVEESYWLKIMDKNELPILFGHLEEVEHLYVDKDNFRIKMTFCEKKYHVGFETLGDLTKFSKLLIEILEQPKKYEGGGIYDETFNYV